MSPIRVAIAGLSANSTSGWGANAHFPYLNSARGKQHYEIVALLNSSEGAAKAAIEHFKLPATTKAYGSADSLAADLESGKVDVNLLVVTTRVDLHYPAVIPVLKVAAAKKNPEKPFGFLVEWPLAGNLADIRELTGLAASNPQGIRTAVGLQGRLAPFYEAVRDVIRSGRLGKILSSEARTFTGPLITNKLPAPFAYLVDRKVGGNVYTISTGHMLDSILHVLGQLQDVQPQFHVQRPDITILEPNKDGALVESKVIKSSVPDLITIVGRLHQATSPADVPIAPQGAPLSFRLRVGGAFPGEPGLVWTILGEKGELRLSCESGPNVQAQGAGPHEEGPNAVKIAVHDFESGKVTDVEYDFAPWQKNELASDASGNVGLVYSSTVPARNIGALYEAYAAGDESRYATFAGAAAWHETLESWIKDWSA